jgi:hypothetical protein
VFLAAAADFRSGRTFAIPGRCGKADVVPNPAFHVVSLRKRIEECFGWGKTVSGLAQLKVRGLDKVRAVFVLGVAVRCGSC